MRRLRRTWRAADADHIPRGRRVGILVDPATAPKLALCAGVLGMPLPTARYGVVEHRQVEGSYMVQLEGSKWGIAFDRAQLLYPIPENVLVLDPSKRRTRRRP